MAKGANWISYDTKLVYASQSSTPISSINLFFLHISLISIIIPTLYCTIVHARMSTLLSLPIETLLQISAEVHREDIENYSISCNRIFELSMNVLQKHRSRKRFRHASVSAHFGEAFTLRSPSEHRNSHLSQFFCHTPHRTRYCAIR